MMEKSQNSTRSKIEQAKKQIIQVLSLVDELPFLKYAVIAVQSLVLILIIITENIASIPQAQIISQVVVGSQTFSYVVVWTYHIVVLLLFLGLFISISVKNRKIFFERTLTFSYVFLQLFLVFYQIHLAKIIKETSIYLAVISAFFLLLSLLILYLGLELHLLGLLSVFVVFTALVAEISFWKILLFCLLTCLFWKEKPIEKKLGYAVLMFTIFWSYCHTRLTNQNSLQFLIFVCLIVSFLVFFWMFKQILVEQGRVSLLFELAGRVKQAKAIILLTMTDKQKLLLIVREEMQEDEERKNFLTNKILSGEISHRDVFEILESVSKKQKESVWIAIQIQILRGENILKIFHLLGQIHPATFLQSLKLEKLKLKAEKLNSSSWDKNIDMGLFQEMNIKIETFYSNIYRCSEKLIEFWRLVLCPSFTALEIHEQFTDVLGFEEKAKANLQHIEGMHSCFRERELLKQMSHLINHYIGEKAEKEYQQKKKQLKEETSESNFILWENDQILDVSSTLLVDLGLERRNKNFLQKSELIPQQLTSFIQKKIANSEKDFLVPLLSKKRVVVKRASIYLLPSYNASTKCVMILKNVGAGQCFLIDVHKNQIKGFSKEFAEKLKDSSQAQTMQLIPEEFFHLNLGQQNLQIIKSGQQLLSEVSLKFLKIKSITNSVANQNLKVHLSYMAQFKDERNDLMLIEMKSPIYEKVNPNYLKVQQQEQSLIQLTSKNKIKLFQNQPYFCKIKNPYGDTIADKLENSGKNHTWTSSVFLIIIFVALGLLIMVSMFCLKSFEDERHSQYLRFLTEAYQLNNEYQDLISLFYESIIRYFTQKFQTEVLAYNPNLNISQMLGSYASSIDKNLKSILITEWSNPFQKDKTDINYEFNFGLFVMPENTNKNGIITILQEVKKSILSQNITFLVNNYNAIRGLEKAYRLNSAVASQIEKFPDKPNALIKPVLALGSFFIALAFAVIVLTKKIIMSRIYDYLSLVKSPQYCKIFKRILKLIEAHPVLRHYDNLNQNKCEKSIKKGIEQASLVRLQASVKKEIIVQGFFSIVVKNNLFIAFLALLLLGGFYYQSELANEINSYKNIVDYIQKMQTSSNFVLTQMTDVLNAAAWKQIYNTTNIYGTSNSLSLKTSFDSSLLPNLFDTYKAEQLKKLYQDLCLSSYMINDLSYLDGVPCDKVYDGALKKGFSIAYESYRNSLSLMRNSSLSELLNIKRFEDKYPIFIEASYARRLTTRLIGFLATRFIDTASKYSLGLVDTMNNQVVLVFFALSVMLILVSTTIYAFKQRCEVALSILKAIPKSTLLDIKHSKEMRDSNFLASLQRL